MQEISQQSYKKYSKLAITAAKHFSNKKIKEATKPVSQLLKSNWNDPSHFFQTGIAAYNANAFETSIKLYQRALELPATKNVKHSDILMSLGLSYAALGRFQDAISQYDTAFDLAPENALILNNRALAYSHLGNQEKALSDLRLAFSISPANTNITLNLVRTLKEAGLTEEALQLLENNLILHQENPDILIAMGNLKKETDALSALVYFRKAAHLAPTNSLYLNLYADIFKSLGNLNNFEGLDQDLLLLLSNDKVLWEKLNWIMPRHLKSKPAFKELQPALAQAVKLNQDINLDFGKVAQVLTDNVMLAALKRMRLSDPEIEKLLELFRRQTLTAIISDIDLDPALSKVLLAILVPLAQYCFASEYIFTENKLEKEAVEKILAEFESSKVAYSEKSALKFVIACCYHQPYKVPALVTVAQSWKNPQSEGLKTLIKLTITEPLLERDIQKNIPKITPISDSISLSVQEQYEENPYPRWLHFPYRGSSNFANNLATILPALEGKRPDLPANPEVLIAGCGTGKQPISTALAFPETKLLAVDLSLASIAYAKRKTKELNLENIEYGQADIMELGSLNRKFNIVECAGVLHHMNDPVVGWKVLCDLLEDDGFMLIGLYSELGRQDIVAAREFIKENGYSNDVSDIRQCRKALLALDDDSLAKQVVRHGDFYTTSACRDLIFHVQEHRFTIPKIVDALDKLGLEFLGFTLSSQHIEAAYKKMFPNDTYQNDLSNWEQFEEKYPDTFSSMYKFWVRKKR